MALPEHLHVFSDIYCFICESDFILRARPPARLYARCPSHSQSPLCSLSQFSGCLIVLTTAHKHMICLHSATVGRTEEAERADVKVYFSS